MSYTCIENIEVNEEVDGCLNAWVRSLTGSLTTTLHGVHPLRASRRYFELCRIIVWAPGVASLTTISAGC